MTTTVKLERSTFRTSRLLDFCSQKELVAQTGHRPEAWPLVLLKELVDNALDACEEAGIPPEVHVKVERGKITVTDNGPGIPKETVAAILDFSVRVSSREAYVSPTRGAQGNALKTVIAMPFVLHGECGRVDILAPGIRHEIAIQVDRISQEPRIAHDGRPEELGKIGTSVRVYWPDSACSTLEAARDRFLQIAKDYTWLNPHLTISVDWFGEECAVRATDPSWKKWLPSDPTSPHWYREDHLERLVAAYITHEREHGRDRTLREFVAEFRGLSSSAKQKVVLEEAELPRAKLAELAKDGELDHGAISRLLDAMKAHTRPVRSNDLGLIGRDHFAVRCQEAGAEMDSFQYKRAQGETDGVPWVVEASFAWLGEESNAERRLVAGVNWSPGVLDPFREMGKFGTSLDSVLEQQRAGCDEPVVLVLHMACPRVEYTDRGKSAVVIGGGEPEEDEGR